MALTTADRDLVRDEIGTAEPPTDAELDTLHDTLGYWRLVALRVLKRRRAAIAASEGGGVSQITIPGALGVGFRGTDLSALDAQIARLEGEHAAAVGGYSVSTGTVQRILPR